MHMHMHRSISKSEAKMRGGVLSMLAVLVVVSSAFSPTALAPRSAVSLRVRSVSAPVAMAGWNDQYQDDDPGRKKQVRALCVTPTHTHMVRHMLSLLVVPWQELKTDKNDFDAEMARTGALGGMDSAPPAFIGLSLAIVAYLLYLVVAS
tara:strand:- start:191 stop:637 length:447 start_codon:yes stop_codon:yes gene_type:complete